MLQIGRIEAHPRDMFPISIEKKTQFNYYLQFDQIESIT